MICGPISLDPGLLMIYNYLHHCNIFSIKIFLNEVMLRAFLVHTAPRIA